MSAPYIIIVGAGARGLLYLKLLWEHMGLRTSAIVENNPAAHEMARRRAADLGSPDVQVFAVLEDALPTSRSNGAKTVFITTPEHTHLELYRKALDAGCHVLLEKPVAATRDEALQILELSRSSTSVTQVGFVLRHSEFYRRIHELVQAGRLGSIVTLQMNERLNFQAGASYRRNWRRLKKYSGGFINEKCSHDLDLMCWLKASQAEPVEIVSRAGRKMFADHAGTAGCTGCEDTDCPYRTCQHAGLNMLEGKVFRDATHAPDDLCVFRSDADIFNHQTVLISFSDGTQGTFTAIASTGNPGRDIAVFGTRGCLWGNLEQGELTLREYWGDKTEDLSLGPMNPHGNADPALLREFMDCVHADQRPHSTVGDGVLASLLAFAADESVQTSAPVWIPGIATP